MIRVSPFPKRTQEGIALLEALIAVVLLAIGLLGTVGLQSRAYSALTEAGLRAEATIAAERLMGTMTTDVANLNNYQVNYLCTTAPPTQDWLKLACGAIPGSRVIVSVVAPTAVNMPNDVTIEIRWTRKAGTPENRHVLRAFI